MSNCAQWWYASLVFSYHQCSGCFVCDVMCVCVCLMNSVLSRSVMSNSLWPYGLAPQAPLSLAFSRQEYWSGLPFPSPGESSSPGMEPASPALAGGFFTTHATWEACWKEKWASVAATQARWVNCGAGRQTRLTTGLAVPFRLMPDP